MKNEKIEKIKEFLFREIFLIVALFLLFFFYILWPEEVKGCYKFVNWKTIKSFLGLFIIVSALEESGFLYRLADILVGHVKTKRKLALLLVSLAALLSPFLTNDVSLFIIIPVTLSLSRIVTEVDILKLLVFETIAVNVGSALTPLGNPQNLFLWHSWNIFFLTFVYKMFPLVAVLFFILLGMVWYFFPSQYLDLSSLNVAGDVNVDNLLFGVSVINLGIYIVCLEHNMVNPALVWITILYFIFYRRVYRKIDWLFLILLIVIFMDMHIVSSLPFVVSLMNRIDLSISKTVFGFSILLSQFISNVPASIYMTKFSTDWLAISYGVNVGGNGLILASLANLIALRLGKRPSFWKVFHIYSVPYLLLSSVVVYILFFR